MKAFVLLFPAALLTLQAQPIPDVTCHIEDYPVKAVTAWQFPQTQGKVQVVILRDPAGEQEARFDLTHGASLISLRYRGKELLFGETAGASVSMFATRRGNETELKSLPPYWSAYSPDQGSSSMGIPATTVGVACNGQSSMRAFAMMQDRGVDNSFQAQPLLGLAEGHISKNFPPGYGTPFSIETTANWTANPSGAPKFYLQLDQSVVNTRPAKTGRLEWYLTASAPWNFSHAANSPANCSDKAPCRSNTVNALATGRYEDEAKQVGFAVVAPSDGWATKREYIRDNAEYVVLLYNAVWAYPRHTFAAVFEHPLDGVAAHRFHWFICAGPWSQAQAFADSQPIEHAEPLPEAPELPPTSPTKPAVRVACETTTYKPQPNQEDQAIVLRDPAGEQTAIFDTTQGGALVSLRYHGVEHIWGYNGGGLLQMAFHNHMSAGPWDGDYNPTQAGDGTANSPVTGIACEGTNSAVIQTMMLDFNHNNGFYSKPLISVWGGRVNDMSPLSYFSPYVLETAARWVNNPSGTPKYYLQLKERFVHIADEKIGSFAYDFAAYEPWEFDVRAVSPENCPCPSSQTSYVAGGWYLNEKRDEGLAVSMPSSNFPKGKVNGGFNSDYMWRNRNFHLGSDEALDGIASKDFVWYVMTGPWTNALAFSSTLK